MEKYVTSLKELIAQSSRNLNEMNDGAKKNDPKSCFQLGMVYLLGINTAIDFKKAGHYFANQSLASDPETHRMLGFISELEGDYPSAFMNYAKAAGSVVDGLDGSYIEKVFQEREALRDWLNKWKLPTRVLNNAITSILKDYTKGGDKREKSSIEIAAICRDAPSCVIAAQLLSDSGNYSDAMQWLILGNVESDNPVYKRIESKLNEISSSIYLSEVLEVIEVEDESLLSCIDIAGIFAPARNTLKEISTRCSRLWRKEVLPKIETIKGKWEKEEKNRIKKEEDDRRHALKQAELMELEEKSRKKKRRDKIISIILFVLFFPLILGSLFADMSTGEKIMAIIIFAIIPMLLVRWIVIKVVDYFNK